MLCTGTSQTESHLLIQHDTHLVVVLANVHDKIFIKSAINFFKYLAESRICIVSEIIFSENAHIPSYKFQRRRECRQEDDVAVSTTIFIA